MRYLEMIQSLVNDCLWHCIQSSQYLNWMYISLKGLQFTDQSGVILFVALSDSRAT